MIYAVINVDMAVEHGFDLATHNVYDNRMIVNENELRMLGDDISSVASSLGGYTMSSSEISDFIRLKKELLK